MAKVTVGEKKHLAAVDHDKDGHLALGASSLNTRYWTGSLSYFERPEDAPNAPTATAELDSGVTDVKWIPDTGRLAVCCDSGTVYLWKLSAERNALTCLSQSSEHDDIVSSLNINADASKFVTTSYDRSIKVWTTEDFVPTSNYTGHYDIVWNAAFHPVHPDIFISCSRDGRLILWDLRKPKPARIMGHKLPSLPTCVAWQPGNEHMFAVGTESGNIVLEDSRLESSRPVMKSTHSRLIQRIAFAPHRSCWLASVSNDCTTAVTDLQSSEVIYRNLSHKDFVKGLSWNPVNNFLTTCSWESKVLSSEIPIKANDETPNTVERLNNASILMDTEPTN